MGEQFYWDKHIFLGSDHRVKDTAEQKVLALLRQEPTAEVNFVDWRGALKILKKPLKVIVTNFLFKQNFNENKLLHVSFSRNLLKFYLIDSSKIKGATHNGYFRKFDLILHMASFIGKKFSRKQYQECSYKMVFWK